MVRMAEYDPLLRPDPDVREPRPIENLGSIPFLAEMTARLSPDTYTRIPDIFSLSVTSSGRVYPRVMLFTLR